MRIQTGIVTVSDRAARGAYPDRSGPALVAAVRGRAWDVRGATVVPDEVADIQQAVRAFLAQGCNLVLTTGGTGISTRDVTPEAIRALAVKELPGFGELMRARSFPITPHALLSRGLAAVVGSALVVCLPGSPAGAVECLDFVVEAIPHALEVLAEGRNA